MDRDRLKAGDELCCMVRNAVVARRSTVRSYVCTYIYMETNSNQGGHRHAISPCRPGRTAYSSLFQYNLLVIPYRRLASFLNVPSQVKITFIAGMPFCTKTDIPSLSFSFLAALL